MKKSYNKDALRGSVEMTDDVWAKQVEESTGVTIPQNLLFTPDAPRYFLKKVREMNLDAMAADEIPVKKAQMAAENQYKAAREDYETLLKFNQKNDKE